MSCDAMNKAVRWQQRFQNLEHAYAQLKKGLALAKPSDIERQGIIQSFEFTFELSWKSLKDYLESKGVLVSFPRDVIKQAFHHEILEEGEVWLQMLDKRNLLAHTYDEEKTEEAMKLIREKFFGAVTQLIGFFEKESP